MNTKSIILKEGERVFADKGYYKTRMDDIAKSAKIAKGTIYLYFKSKKDLFISIIEKSLEDFYIKIKGISEKEEDETKKLKGIIKESINEFADKKMFLRKVEIHRLMEEKELKKEFENKILPIFKKINDYIVGIIKKGIKNKKIKGEKPEIIASFIFGGIRNACLMGNFMYMKSTNKNLIEKEIFNIVEKGIFKS